MANRWAFEFAVKTSAVNDVANAARELQAAGKNLESLRGPINDIVSKVGQLSKNKAVGMSAIAAGVEQRVKQAQRDIERLESRIDAMRREGMGGGGAGIREIPATGGGQRRTQVTQNDRLRFIADELGIPLSQLQSSFRGPRGGGSGHALPQSVRMDPNSASRQGFTQSQLTTVAMRTIVGRPLDQANKTLSSIQSIVNDGFKQMPKMMESAVSKMLKDLQGRQGPPRNDNTPDLHAQAPPVVQSPGGTPQTTVEPFVRAYRLVTQRRKLVTGDDEGHHGTAKLHQDVQRRRGAPTPEEEKQVQGIQAFLEAKLRDMMRLGMIDPSAPMRGHKQLTEPPKAGQPMSVKQALGEVMRENNAQLRRDFPLIMNGSTSVEGTGLIGAAADRKDDRGQLNARLRAWLAANSTDASLQLVELKAIRRGVDQILKHGLKGIGTIRDSSAKEAPSDKSKKEIPAESMLFAKSKIDPGNMVELLKDKDSGQKPITETDLKRTLEALHARQAELLKGLPLIQDTLKGKPRGEQQAILSATFKQALEKQATTLQTALQKAVAQGMDPQKILGPLMAQSPLKNVKGAPAMVLQDAGLAKIDDLVRQVMAADKHDSRGDGDFWRRAMASRTGASQTFGTMRNDAGGGRGSVDTNRGMYRGNVPLGDQFADATRRAALYGSAAGMLYGGARSIQEGVATMSDFEEQMIAIDRVLNPIGANMARVSAEAKNLGQEFGQSIIEVGSAMQIYAQQGKDTSQIVEQTKVALMSANVTTLDVVQSVEALTATQKQFRMASTQTIRILDAWNEVENTTSVNTEVLAGALRTVGTTARLSGMDFESFLGVVASVGEATRKTGQAIGNSLKFMFQRLRQDKAITALQDVGVFSIDIDGNIADADRTLQMLRDRWDNLSDAQRQNTAVSIAGTRHANDFLVLMETWDRALDIAATAQLSHGSAMRENEKTMESMNKKVAQLKASYQSLWASLGESGALDMLKAAADGLRGILNLVKGIGDLGGNLTGGLAGVAALAGAGASAYMAYGGAGIGLPMAWAPQSIQQGHGVLQQQRPNMMASMSRGRMMSRTGVPMGGMDPMMMSSLMASQMNPRIMTPQGQAGGGQAVPSRAMVQPSRGLANTVGAVVTIEMLRGMVNRAEPDSEFRGPSLSKTATNVGATTLTTGLAARQLMQGPGIMKALGVLTLIAGGKAAFDDISDFTSGGQGSQTPQDRMDELGALQTTVNDTLNRIRETRRGLRDGTEDTDVFQQRELIDTINAIAPGTAGGDMPLLDALNKSEKRLQEIVKELRAQRAEGVNKLLADRFAESETRAMESRRAELESLLASTPQGNIDRRLQITASLNQVKTDLSNALLEPLKAQAKLAGGADNVGFGIINASNVSNYADRAGVNQERLMRQLLDAFLEARSGRSLDIDKLLKGESAIEAGSRGFVQLDRGGPVFRIADMQEVNIVDGKVDEWRRKLMDTGGVLVEAFDTFNGRQFREAESFRKLINDYTKAVGALIGKNEELIASMQFVNRSMLAAEGPFGGTATTDLQAGNRITGELLRIQQQGQQQLFPDRPADAGAQQDFFQQMVSRINAVNESGRGISLSGLMDAQRGLAENTQSVADMFRTFADQAITSAESGSLDSGVVNGLKEAFRPEQWNRINQLLVNLTTQEAGSAEFERIAGAVRDAVVSEFTQQENAASRQLNQAMRSQLEALQTAFRETQDQLASALANAQATGMNTQQFMQTPDAQQAQQNLMQLQSAMEGALSQMQNIAGRAQRNESASGSGLELLKKNVREMEASVEATGNVTRNLNKNLDSLAEGVNKVFNEIEGRVQGRVAGMGLTGTAADNMTIRLLQEEFRKLDPDDPRRGETQRQIRDAIDQSKLSRNAELQRRQSARSSVLGAAMNAQTLGRLGMGGDGMQTFVDAVSSDFRDSIQMFLAANQQQIAQLTGPQRGEFVDKLVTTLSPMADRIREMEGNDRGMNYLLASQSEQMGADMLRSQLRSGVSAADALSDPKMRMVVKDSALLREILEESLNNDTAEKALQYQADTASNTAAMANAFTAMSAYLRSMLAKGTGGGPAKGFMHGTIGDTSPVTKNGRISGTNVVTVHDGEVILNKEQADHVGRSFKLPGFETGTLSGLQSTFLRDPFGVPDDLKSWFENVVGVDSRYRPQSPSYAKELLAPVLENNAKMFRAMESQGARGYLAGDLALEGEQFLGRFDPTTRAGFVATSGNRGSVQVPGYVMRDTFVHEHLGHGLDWAGTGFDRRLAMSTADPKMRPIMEDVAHAIHQPGSRWATYGEVFEHSDEMFASELFADAAAAHRGYSPSYYAGSLDDYTRSGIGQRLMGRYDELSDLYMRYGPDAGRNIPGSYMASATGANPSANAGQFMFPEKWDLKPATYNKRTLDFDTDLDRALFEAGGKGRQAHPQRELIMQLLEAHTGKTRGELVEMGKGVRTSVRELVGAADDVDDLVRVPQMSGELGDDIAVFARRAESALDIDDALAEFAQRVENAQIESAFSKQFDATSRFARHSGRFAQWAGMSEKLNVVLGMGNPKEARTVLGAFRQFEAMGSQMGVSDDIIRATMDTFGVQGIRSLTDQLDDANRLMQQEGIGYFARRNILNHMKQSRAAKLPYYALAGGGEASLDAASGALQLAKGRRIEVLGASGRFGGSQAQMLASVLAHEGAHFFTQSMNTQFGALGQAVDIARQAGGAAELGAAGVGSRQANLNRRLFQMIASAQDPGMQMSVARVLQNYEAGGVLYGQMIAKDPLGFMRSHHMSNFVHEVIGHRVQLANRGFPLPDGMRAMLGAAAQDSHRLIEALQSGKVTPDQFMKMMMGSQDDMARLLGSMGYTGHGAEAGMMQLAKTGRAAIPHSRSRVEALLRQFGDVDTGLDTAEAMGRGQMMSRARPGRGAAAMAAIQQSLEDAGQMSGVQQSAPRGGSGVPSRPAAGAINMTQWSNAVDDIARASGLPRDVVAGLAREVQGFDMIMDGRMSVEAMARHFGQEAATRTRPAVTDPFRGRGLAGSILPPMHRMEPPPTPVGEATQISPSRRAAAPGAAAPHEALKGFGDSRWARMRDAADDVTRFITDNPVAQRLGDAVRSPYAQLGLSGFLLADAFYGEDVAHSLGGDRGKRIHKELWQPGMRELFHLLGLKWAMQGRGYLGIRPVQWLMRTGAGWLDKSLVTSKALQGLTTAAEYEAKLLQLAKAGSGAGVRANVARGLVRGATGMNAAQGALAKGMVPHAIAELAFLAGELGFAGARELGWVTDQSSAGVLNAEDTASSGSAILGGGYTALLTGAYSLYDGGEAFKGMMGSGDQGAIAGDRLRSFMRGNAYVQDAEWYESRFQGIYGSDLGNPRGAIDDMAFFYGEWWRAATGRQQSGPVREFQNAVAEMQMLDQWSSLSRVLRTPTMAFVKPYEMESLFPQMTKDKLDPRNGLPEDSSAIIRARIAQLKVQMDELGGSGDKPGLIKQYQKMVARMPESDRAGTKGRVGQLQSLLADLGQRRSALQVLADRAAYYNSEVRASGAANAQRRGIIDPTSFYRMGLQLQGSNPAGYEKLMGMAGPAAIEQVLRATGMGDLANIPSGIRSDISLASMALPPGHNVQDLISKISGKPISTEMSDDVLVELLKSWVQTRRKERKDKVPKFAGPDWLLTAYKYGIGDSRRAALERQGKIMDTGAIDPGMAKLVQEVTGDINAEKRFKIIQGALQSSNAHGAYHEKYSDIAGQLGKWSERLGFSYTPGANLDSISSALTSFEKQSPFLYSGISGLDSSHTELIAQLAHYNKSFHSMPKPLQKLYSSHVGDVAKLEDVTALDLLGVGPVKNPDALSKMYRGLLGQYGKLSAQMPAAHSANSQYARMLREAKEHDARFKPMAMERRMVGEHEMVQVPGTDSYVNANNWLGRRIASKVRNTQMRQSKAASRGVATVRGISNVFGRGHTQSEAGFWRLVNSRSPGMAADGQRWSSLTDDLSYYEGLDSSDPAVLQHVFRLKADRMALENSSKFGPRALEQLHNMKGQAVKREMAAAQSDAQLREARKLHEEGSKAARDFLGMPSFASGTHAKRGSHMVDASGRLREDTVAQLHAGEMVVPAHQVNDILPHFEQGTTAPMQAMMDLWHSHKSKSRDRERMEKLLEKMTRSGLIVGQTAFDDETYQSFQRRLGSATLDGADYEWMHDNVQKTMGMPLDAALYMKWISRHNISTKKDMPGLKMDGGRVVGIDESHKISSSAALSRLLRARRQHRAEQDSGGQIDLFKRLSALDQNWQESRALVSNVPGMDKKTPQYAAMDKAATYMGLQSPEDLSTALRVMRGGSEALSAMPAHERDNAALYASILQRSIVGDDEHVSGVRHRDLALQDRMDRFTTDDIKDYYARAQGRRDTEAALRGAGGQSGAQKAKQAAEAAQRQREAEIEAGRRKAASRAKTPAQAAYDDWRAKQDKQRAMRRQEAEERLQRAISQGPFSQMRPSITAEDEAAMDAARARRHEAAKRMMEESAQGKVPMRPSITDPDARVPKHVAEFMRRRSRRRQVGPTPIPVAGSAGEAARAVEHLHSQTNAAAAPPDVSVFGRRPATSTGEVGGGDSAQMGQILNRLDAFVADVRQFMESFGADGFNGKMEHSGNITLSADSGLEGMMEQLIALLKQKIGLDPEADGPKQNKIIPQSTTE